MKWFKEKFLPSFKVCENKRISKKQFDIFKKYLWKNEVRETYDADSGEYTMEVDFDGRMYTLYEKHNLWEANVYLVSICDK